MKLFDAAFAQRSIASIALVWFCLPFPPQAQNLAKPESDSPTILVGSATATDNGELASQVKTMEGASCNPASRHFDHPTTVGDFVGGKVKTLRILHYARRRNPPKPEETQTLMRKVWQGSFYGADCGIAWDEGALWSIESTLEFEDGKKGLLITDGIHVALRDHDGKNWFFRLLPAAQ